MSRPGLAALVALAVAVGGPAARAEESTGDHAAPVDRVDDAVDDAADAADKAAADDDGSDDDGGDAEPAAKPKPKPKARKTSSSRKKASATGKLSKTEDKVAGGLHWRIESGGGAIHVWIPPAYDRSTAGTVVYVHGYHTDVDGAWKDYGLAAQFKASRQNAMFIVPEAPSGRDDNVKWNALTDLRKAVTRANIRLPDGPTIVMGHSGAFRTVMKWVDHKAVAQVILLDALYGGASAFDEFIGTGKRAEYHKMIVIGDDTASESKAFSKQYPFAVTRDKLPESVGDFTRREKRAKLLYVKSQYGHMQMVTNGKVIPLLLRLTPLKAL